MLAQSTPKVVVFTRGGHGVFGLGLLSKLLNYRIIE